MNCDFRRKIKTQSFQKLFSGGHLFVFVEYLCKRSPKIKTKNIKKYSSILAIVNHRNWLDDSPPLMFNRFAYFWPKGYQRESLGKSYQNDDYQQQAMRKSCLPAGIEPAAVGLPVHCSTTIAREDVSSRA